MKKNIVVRFHLPLNLDDIIDVYLYDYLIYCRFSNPDDSYSDILKRIVFRSAFCDVSFKSYDSFLDNFYCYLEDNKK